MCALQLPVPPLSENVHCGTAADGTMIQLDANGGQRILTVEQYAEETATPTLESSPPMGVWEPLSTTSSRVRAPLPQRGTMPGGRVEGGFPPEDGDPSAGPAGAIGRRQARKSEKQKVRFARCVSGVSPSQCVSRALRTPA